MGAPTEGNHIFGVGLAKDTGCTLHDACLKCPERICIEDDGRLTHKQYRWFLNYVELVKAVPGSHDLVLYQRCLDTTRALCIGISRRERREHRAALALLRAGGQVGME